MPSTPPRSERTSAAAQSSVSDTPYKAKHATSAPVIYADGLDEGRDAVVADVGPVVPQVTIQWFMDNIMPRLRPDLDISAVVQKLKDNKTIVSESGTWADFPTAPADCLEHEDDVFDSLETVAAAIRNAATAVCSRKLKPAVVFKCRPRDMPVSKRRENTSRPDGYGLCVKHRSNHGNRKRVFWETIVSPCEVKKRERVEDINDNIAKILWSFHHIMREDPSRRFVVGFTIENRSMRLWFGSRTDALVTDPFDFTRDHATLVHFFLSLMYAEVHELGYDPTIQPARAGRKRTNQWDITVHYSEAGPNEDLSRPVDISKLETVTMRTKTLEADFGAEAMRSRGTRVWSGRILGNGKWGGKLGVLKDYWVEHDRLREATIREKILGDVETDEDRDTLSSHLLTPMCSGDVVIAGEMDTTHNLRHGADVPTVKMYPTIHEEKPSAIDTIPKEAEGSIPQGTGTLRPPLERVRATVMLCDKSHHRIIFMEVAQTIEQILSVHDVLDAGSQAAKALKIMHKYGWVHRDVSSGNILVVDGVVKISDLEYAKKMGDETSHNGRSGTALFMSVEARRHGYLFYPKVTSSEGPALPQVASALANANPEGTDSKDSDSGSTTPFRYNPLHDLESLWWVLVYLLLRRPTKILGDTSKRYEEQLRHFDVAFTSELMDRLEMFQSRTQFANGIKMLHRRLDRVAVLLNGTRQNLLIQYLNAEKQAPIQIDHKVGDATAGFMVSDFETVAKEYAGDKDVELCELRPPPEQKLEPEQPTAATVIATSLDSRLGLRASGLKKRSNDEEIGGPSQRRRVQIKPLPTKKGTQGPQTSEEATQPVQQVAGTSAKGKGKAKGKAKAKGKGKGKGKAKA